MMHRTDQTCFTQPRGWRRKRFHLPIAAVLTAGFGGLMLLAVASVLILGLNTSGRNTFQLLTDKAELLIGGLEARVRAQLEPARHQAEFLARQIAAGDVDPDDRARMSDLLRGSLAPSPQITGVAFLNTEGVWLAATRELTGVLEIGAFPDPEGAADDLEAARQTGSGVWVDPEWVEDLKTSVLSVRAPVRRDGRFLGAIVTGVGFQDLSRFLAQVGGTGQTGSAFILYDDKYVIAHPSMVDMTRSFADAQAKGVPPLPLLSDIDDPVAAAIWSEVDPAGIATGRGDLQRGEKAEVRITSRFRRLDIEFREATVGETDYIYLLRRITEYGAHPWTLVIAFPASSVAQEVDRLARTAGIGIVILVIAVVLSLLLGRTISRQIARLASAAIALRELDFRNVPDIPDSRFREISNAAQAFNTMVAGLRWFETYVPKALVLRLIRREGAEQPGVASEERDVTVMFTDIKGFSTLAERMSPGETATMLNAHFTRLAACIEAEGGTVDKYIGDAIMAFWGAPDEQPDHAARALRAARAIVEAVQEEARQLAAKGLPPVCLRIGLHSGPVVVGNIGARSRINYTIVGDTVNTAARLEALGDELIEDSCAVVLASDDTVRAGCAIDVPMREVGRFSLRGKSGPVRVWRLLADYAVSTSGAAANETAAAPNAGTAAAVGTSPAAD